MSRTGSTGKSPLLWVAVGSGFSGVATYALLVVVARAVGPVRYADFSVFWTFVVVVSLGAFLPIEQLVARSVAQRRAEGRTAEGLSRRGIGLGAVVAAVVLGLGGAGLALTDVSLGAEVQLALAVVVAGFVVQFAARGVLAGLGQLRGYALVLSVDAGGRAVVAVALWAAGVTSLVPYLVAVSSSCVACACVGWVLARRAVARTAGPARPAGPAGPGFRADAGATVPGVRQLGALVLAASCMQLLLNSGVLAARATSGADAALAGVVLAVLTLVRLPVFVFQAAQAAYVSRISALFHLRSARRLRRLLIGLALVVATVSVLTVAVSVVAGPALVRLIFGPGYDVGRDAAALMSAGVAAYLVASVLNDVAVAIGAHRAVAAAWPLGVAVAVAAYSTADGVVLASTLPLVAGAGVAALVLLPQVVRRSRTVVSEPPAAAHTAGTEEIADRD